MAAATRGTPRCRIPMAMPELYRTNKNELPFLRCTCNPCLVVTGTTMELQVELTTDIS